MTKLEAPTRRWLAPLLWLLALAPVVTWAASPARDERDALARRLEQARRETALLAALPGAPAGLAATEAEWAQLRGRLAPLDDRLERWFPGLGPVDGAPRATDFVTAWSRGRDELLARHRPLASDVALLGLDVPASDGLRAAQKRFWIAEACLQALAAGGAQRLLAPIAFPAARPLEGGAGARLPVQLAVAVPFPRLGEVTRALLGCGLLVVVQELRVEPLAFDRWAGQPVDGKAGYFPRRLLTLDERGAQGLGDPAEPAVSATFALEVLDVDLPPGGEGGK